MPFHWDQIVCVHDLKLEEYKHMKCYSNQHNIELIAWDVIP